MQIHIRRVPILRHDSNRIASHNNIVPIGYYVIVGRGVAAWYNHLTLLESEWGRARLAGLPVLHVGFKEPWSLRGEERMGQWPRMLNFFEGIAPGLGLSAIDPNLVAADQEHDESRTWLKSSVFARSIEDVETHIRRRYPFVIDPERRVLQNGQPVDAESIDDRARGDNDEGPLLRIRNGFVGTIERRDGWSAATASTPDYLGQAEHRRRQGIDVVLPGAGVWANRACPYRLSVFYRPEDQDPYLKFFYAKKIDICSGVSYARRPTIQNLDSHEKAAIKGFYDSAFVHLDKEPRHRQPGDRIVDGNTYIGSPNIAQETVVVIKSGAVAAQAVQSALKMPTLQGRAGSVWWISNTHFSKLAALDQGRASESVPGARNQIEIAGARPDATLEPAAERQRQREELLANFNVRVNPPFADIATSANRVEQLRGKLHNLSHHDMADVSGDDNELTIQLDIQGGTRPIAAPDAADALDRTIQNAGEDPASQAARNTFGQQHGLTYSNGNWVRTIRAGLLVFTSGVDRTVEGAPAHLARLLGGPRIVNDPASGYPMVLVHGAHDGEAARDRPGDAGRQGLVRVLGGAMVIAAAGQQGFQAAHRLHYSRLPQEAPAADGGGLNPALVNIQRANGYRYEYLKLNTASPEEMVERGISQSSAFMIESIRKLSVRGYTVSEYRTGLTGHAEREEAEVADLRQDAVRLEQSNLVDGVGLAGRVLGVAGLSGIGQAVVKAWSDLNRVQEFVDRFRSRADEKEHLAQRYRAAVITLGQGNFQF